VGGPSPAMTIGDQVSDNSDFFSRYLGRDDEAGASDTGLEDDDAAGGGGELNGHGAESTTVSPGRGDPEQTSIVDRSQVDAALRRNPPAPPGTAPAGASMSGQPPAAPIADRYWPAAGGGRHGYDAAPDSPREGSAGAGSGPRAQAAGPPADAGERDRVAPSGGARHGSEGPGPADSGPMRAAGRPPGRPQQGPPAAMPNYPPTPAGPDDPRVGMQRHPYPPPPPRGYDEGPTDPRRRPPLPDDGRGASVGDLRAQIRESQVVPPYKPVPQTGWRKGLHRATRINVGLSGDERHWNDLRRRLTVDLRGKYVIAVMGSKGGINKTTATICIGAALSLYRTDKIVAIDANPASGNLAERIDQPKQMSWRGLINDPNLREYTDFRHYLGKHSATGLEVLGSDPGDEALTGNNLFDAWTRLQVQYPIAILDCGNQLRDDLTRTMLQRIQLDAIVVPSTTRLDGAKGAAETLNWLATHGYPHLVREAVVVVSNINKIDASDKVRRLHEDFGRTVRAVHEVPFDQHLSDAVAIDFDRLRPATRKAYIEAAASLVDGFASAADREAGGQRQWGGQP
jgi:MinD-like ATPase involved in chromosome partitioning or flagellar assembly